MELWGDGSFSHFPLVRNLDFSFTFGTVSMDISNLLLSQKEVPTWMLQGTRYLPWGDQGHLSRQYLYCILLQGLLQPTKRKTTPQRVEEGTRKKARREENKHMWALEINIKQHVKSAHPCLTTSALGYALVLQWFLLSWDNSVISCNLKHQQRTRKLRVIMQCNYLKDTNKSGALKK